MMQPPSVYPLFKDFRVELPAATSACQTRLRQAISGPCAASRWRPPLWFPARQGSGAKGNPL